MTRTSRPTSRRTKALVAGGAAVLLLAGAGGSFARWSDSTGVDSASFASGDLGITQSGGTWTDQLGVTVADPANYLMVPGTTLTYNGTLDVVVEGENLEAAITTDFTDVTSSTELAQALEVDMTIDGTDMTVVGAEATSTPIISSGQHPLVITVAFPQTREDGTDWGTYAQDGVLDLTAFDVSLTQDTAATQPVVDPAL
ncbi:hypothetical protein GCM10023169_01280 [Georgenia halophila]|uniref:Alternate-type signal peptide domain-containing protein n=1 Tax=Georgenia halophila TaxID=620889 RepID=A0ABP8KTD1_9MICO